MKFTILGSKGFIGSNLVKNLQAEGVECYCPDIRTDDISGQDLGHVIYAIGIPDFLTRPFDAVEAHVCSFKKIITETTFDSLLYCSGTRVYLENIKTTENSSLSINPNKFEHLYNISKIMGESLCIAAKNPRIKIARLSNVTGNNFESNLFIPSIIREAVIHKKITLQSKLESQKDYIHINDVINILPKICVDGKNQIYNVASGTNLSSKSIIDKIVQIMPVDIEVIPDAKEYSFPPINIDLLKNEFDFKPISILDFIEDMVKNFRNFFQKN